MATTAAPQYARRAAPRAAHRRRSYICGEEPALLEVIKGKRGQPRNMPQKIRKQGTTYAELGADFLDWDRPERLTPTC
jgi:hypothetical protein